MNAIYLVIVSGLFLVLGYLPCTLLILIGAVAAGACIASDGNGQIL